ncbi:MAG: biotin/lipoyl-binding protein [Clostridia bacterium]|nr:biotin/lipoyl-binding protein [Clostridia bacterium]
MIYKVTLNGKIYEVEVEEGEAVLKAEYEAALPQAAPATAAPVASAPAQAAVPAAAPVASGNGEVVKSPLPGNINGIKVAVGQKVKAGDVVIILEAMKMENEISATKDGTISQIFVTKGAVVETGAALVEIA